VARLLRFAFVLLVVLIFDARVTFAQVGIKIPPPPHVVTLFEPEIYGLERFAVDSTLTYKMPKIVKRTVKLDSTAKYVSFSEAIDQTDLRLPAVVDLDTYVDLRLKFDTKQLWKESEIKGLRGKVERSSGAIELDIPFRIKSKTFTRIFGSDRIGLRVTGNISFDLSGRTEDRSGSAISAIESQNTFSPRFRQTQQFTVEGKIGEKVTVSVEQNSEATVDIENTLRLRYDGDEDEIVQKIEAGNISLSLPSTKYVIFGGSNQGLFGLKSEMKMGNLNFTAIASLEKGQQQELSISGSSSESKTTIKDTDFIKNRYFFIDTYFRDQFEPSTANDPQQPTVDPDREVVLLDIYESTTYSEGDARYGVAVLDPLDLNSNGNYSNVNIDAIDNLDELINDGKAYSGYFKRLEPDVDYVWDSYRGFFRLNQTANDNSALAIAYAVYSTSIPQVGTLTSDLADSSQAVVLKLIKPKNMQPSNVDTWPLMMRNVYSLGGTNIEADGFDLRLEYNVTGNHDTYPEGGSKSFLNLLGLDLLNENGDRIEGGDEQIDNNPVIRTLSDGILIFPALEPFNPPEDSRFKDAITDKYRVDMYNLSTSNTQELLNQSKFEMIVTSKSTKSTFDLGFYVLEGSEVVTLGGRTLQRDKDYLIDYFSGQLTLLSSEAKRASSNIQIKYERANLFQLDKKTIFGGRLEYQLWDNSFIGLTALYLNKSTLDRRVRVGQEPFQNFVWDINAAFKFKPRFITRALDWLPLVETNAESNIDVEGEFAQVLPDPNTLNNEKTGDDNGVGYVDDFEASKRTTTLGIRYRTWSPASPPKTLPALEAEGQSTPVDSSLNKYKAHIAWFNPYQQTHINDIWPNRDVNSQTGQTTDVLGVDIWRDADSDPDLSWAGMMRSTISFADQQKTKYIELWVKGSTGKINVDIGRISEDYWMTGKNVFGKKSYGNLNTEDKNTNGLLDEGEDVGIDGIANGQPGDDPNDEWGQPVDGAISIDDRRSYDKINGTEGNSNSREARYPDTEDLDGDGSVSRVNEYFEYSFSLDPGDIDAKRWIAGETEAGWRLFRIPLNEPTHTEGSPDPNFQQIYNVRMWFSDIPTERTRIKIAAFDFVGNEWEEVGIADNDTSTFVQNDTLFTLATYNSEENTEDTGTDIEPYKSPPGVTGVRDRITNALSKEQSLVLRLGNPERTEGLKAGQVAEAKKTLYSALDLLNYKRMKMFVHGDWIQIPIEPPVDNNPADSTKLAVYLRFGADNNNYYEYGQDIYQGWNTKNNNFDIDLDELSKIKSEPDYFIGTGERIIYKRKLLGGNPGAYYKAVGAPSLKTIRYFIIGVRHLGKTAGRDDTDFIGEIWVDELRLSDVRKENATALRLNTNVRLADVMQFNAQWESTDADFHNVSTQWGGGNTEERQNYSGKLTLDKFFPDSWDLSVPVDARASFTRSIPKYTPKTDELTGYSNNTIDKKIKSLFGLRSLPDELKDQVSESEVLGVGANIKKRSKSKRWYLRYTLDEMSLDFDYSKRHSSSWETEYNDAEQYKESFQYKVPFGKNNFFEPFKFVSKIPVLKKLSDQKLYYTPDNINFSLNITDNETRSLRRQTGDSEFKVNRVVSTSSNRSVSSSYKMLNSLDFSYSRSWQADADFDSLTHQQLLKNIITKWNFGTDTDVNQSFKGDYRPKLLDWLGTDMSYTNNFTFQLTNNNQYKQAANKTQKRIGLDFSPSKLMKAIYTPKSKGSSSTSTRSRRPRGRQPQQTPDEDNQQDKDKEGEEEEGKGFSIPNPLMMVYNVLSTWQNIKTTYTIDNRIDHRFLKGMPSWKYQFGLTQDPGVTQDSSLLLLDTPPNFVGPSTQETQSLRTSTSINIASNIRASFSHDISQTESSTDNGKTRSGSRNSSYFVSGDDPTKDFSGLSGWRAFVPDWSVSISGVEKYLFFSKYAQSISIDHAHQGKYSENLSLTRDLEYLPTSQSFTNNWQPLVGVNIRTVWGVSTTIRTTNSTSFNISSSGGASKTVTDAFSVSLSYSKTSGFKIPLPIWPFKGKTFKNEINFNLTFDKSNNQTFQKQFGQSKFEEKQKNNSWKLRPSATYRFSKRVQGSLFYERGTTENKISGKYSYNEFGITVNIAIRD
jgi:hypothetical protein